MSWWYPGLWIRAIVEVGGFWGPSQTILYTKRRFVRNVMEGGTTYGLALADMGWMT